MNQQMPCTRCGQPVWINPQTNSGACACGNVVGAQPMQPQAWQPQGPQPQAWQPQGPQPQGPQPQGPQPQPMGMQPPGMQTPMPGYQQQVAGMAPPMPGPQQAPTPMPQAGPSPGPSSFGVPKARMAKIIAGAVGVAVLGIGGTVVKKKFAKDKPGKASYSKLSIDRTKANPDELIDAAGGLAVKWRKDATWWTANFHGVRPDGRVDLTAGGTAQITYISPSRVQSAALSKRKDSLKKFRFSANSIDYRQKWDVKKAWKNVVPPGEPQCGVSDLAVSLAQKGFSKGTLHVNFDPQFAWVADAYAWSVKSADNPGLNGMYSMVDCSLLKAAPASAKK